MRIWTSLLASVVLLAADQGGLGPRSPHALAFLLTILLGGLLAFLGLPTERSRRGALVWAGVLVLVACFHFTRDAARAFALAGVLGVTAVGGRADVRTTRTLAGTALLFAVFLCIRDYLPLWVDLDSGSRALSSAAAGMAGELARFGPERSGVWVSLATMAAALATMTGLGVRAIPAGLVALVLAALVAPGAVVLEIVLRPLLLARFPVPLRAETLAVVLAALPIAVLARAHTGVMTVRPPLRRSARIVAAVAAGVGLVMLTAERHFDAAAPRILLDCRGGFSLEKPVWGAYGPDAPQGASLSSLPGLLDAWSFPLTLSDSTLTPEELARHDVLIVMNPREALAPSEQSAVWNFVSAGGGLLVLGDHTDILGTREPLNALLAPVDVRFRFDSAIPDIARWTWYNCLRMHPHPAMRGVRDETDVKVSVGASLELPRDARPLFSGRYAFSDAGNADNARGAFLGNMRYDAGELYGDLLLAAEVPHGRGKVAVFGDTSPFQRTAVAFSHPFLLRLLTELGRPGSAFPARPVRAAGAALLAVGTVVLVAASPAAAWLAAIGSAGLLGLLLLGRLGGVGLSEPDPHTIAWVDVAHANRVDLHSGRDDGVNGLLEHLGRHGLLPLAMKRFEPRRLEGSAAFVTVAPAVPYRGDESAALVRFVENGGLLVVAAGSEESGGAAPLLATFGLSIGDVPLGAAPAAHTTVEGTHVLMHEAWPVEGLGEGDEILAESWGYPMIARCPRGRGSVLVIADSQFLGDGRLEKPDVAVEPNIEFLRRVIASALGTPEASS